MVPIRSIVGHPLALCGSHRTIEPDSEVLWQIFVKRSAVPDTANSAPGTGSGLYGTKEEGTPWVYFYILGEGALR
jgi:hypothetical protein